MKTFAIIQARMSASRLPGKVLLNLADHPMLEWVVERTRKAQLLEAVVVATTLHPSDDPIVDFCNLKGYQVSRGSAHDVLDRYYQAAKHVKADVIVRITADCPLIDPELIDQAIQLFQTSPNSQKIRSTTNASHFDFVANRLPPPWGRTFPIGLDIEIFSMDMLEQASKEATSKYQREHVTPFFYEGTPAELLKYKGDDSFYSSALTPKGHYIALLHHTPDYGKLRWTVDTPQDLDLVRKIVSYFPDDTFSWLAVLSLVQDYPELTQINANVRHKSHLDVDDRYIE